MESEADEVDASSNVDPRNSDQHHLEANLQLHLETNLSSASAASQLLAVHAGTNIQQDACPSFTCDNPISLPTDAQAPQDMAIHTIPMADDAALGMLEILDLQVHDGRSHPQTNQLRLH